MADATRRLQYDACVSAMRSGEPMPPAARLWLARASLFTDAKGRTNYGPARCGTDVGLDADHIAAGIRWLAARGLVVNDHTEQGLECWRLTHTDWTEDATIGGYGRDAGQRRDEYPPQYGRSVADVIDPPTGRQDFTPPSWDEVALRITHQPQPEEDPEW